MDITGIAKSHHADMAKSAIMPLETKNSRQQSRIRSAYCPGGISLGIASTNLRASWEFHCFSCASAEFHKVLRSAYSGGTWGGSMISLWVTSCLQGQYFCSWSYSENSFSPLWQAAAETADSLLLRLIMVILQCGHGKSASSFLPDSGQKNSRIPFQISCLGVPLIGGLFSFLMGYPFDKPELLLL